MRSVLAALGRGGDADAARTADVCLAAAARVVEQLLGAQRFGRESALDLLTADALATYAYEHAAGRSESDLAALARRGAATMGHLMTQRV
jgi:hypothetical protein